MRRRVEQAHSLFGLFNEVPHERERQNRILWPPIGNGSLHAERLHLVANVLWSERRAFRARRPTNPHPHEAQATSLCHSNPEDRMSVQVEAPMACLVCGCTEYEPCPGGCSWAAVVPERNVGICDRCALLPLDELLRLALSGVEGRAA